MTREEKIKALTAVLIDGKPIREALPVKYCFLMEWEPKRYYVDKLDQPHRHETIQPHEADQYIADFRKHYASHIVEVIYMDYEEIQVLHAKFEKEY
jgi:hypothetical protein